MYDVDAGKAGKDLGFSFLPLLLRYLHFTTYLPETRCIKYTFMHPPLESCAS